MPKIILKKAKLSIYKCFIPVSDEGIEVWNKLSETDTFTVEIKKIRCYKYHKKYFEMIKTAFENLPEHYKKVFPKINVFRKEIEMESGYFEPSFDLQKNEIKRSPLSINYDTLDNIQFEKVFNDVADTICNVIFEGKIDKQQMIMDFCNINIL